MRFGPSFALSIGYVNLMGFKVHFVLGLTCMFMLLLIKKKIRAIWSLRNRIIPILNEMENIELVFFRWIKLPFSFFEQFYSYKIH
jgi:isoprenylcysteine carboxyl methyltransferase (ICMT) family protein YpbQ